MGSIVNVADAPFRPLQCGRVFGLFEVEVAAVELNYIQLNTMISPNYLDTMELSSC